MKQSLKKLIDASPVTKRWGQPWGNISAGALAALIIMVLWKLFPVDGTAGSDAYALVERGDVVVGIVETGDVEAVSKQFAAAPMMWGAKLQVVELIPEGTLVHKGDLLIRFDVSDLQTQLDLAVDQLNSFIADLNKLDAQQESTIRNMENQLKLTQFNHEQAALQLEMKQFESEAVKEESRLRLKQAELDLEQMATQLASQKIINHSQRLKMELSIKQARYRTRSLSERIDDLTLYAPAAGMVVYENLGDERLKQGYEASPGTALMSIPDLSRMQVKCYINEADRQKMAVGQRVKIGLEAYPEAVFSGYISSLSMLAQSVQNSVSLKGFVVYVQIELTESDPRLKPGMTAVVTIIEETLQDVIHVPAGAVFEKKGQPVVFLHKSLKSVPVTLKGRSDARIIVEADLAAGQKLSWVPSGDDAVMLGYMDEQQRVETLRQSIIGSFDVFEEKGILFDYLERKDKQEPDDKAGKELRPDDLPASVRTRIQQRGVVIQQQ